MDPVITLPVAFTLGLLSTTHCLGMCGGIIGALSLSMPAPIREQRRRQLVFILLYNLGRLLSYSAVGALAGWLGSNLMLRLDPTGGHTLLQIASAGLLIALGLYIAGWLPQLSRIEKIGVPLWRRIEPFGRRLLPVRSPGQAMLYGMIWGWLPCGMVYTLVLWTTASGGAGTGAATLAAFGLGTLPAMLASGLMAQQIMRFARKPATRRVVGAIIGLSAVVTLYLPTWIAQEHHHELQQLTGVCHVCP